MTTVNLGLTPDEFIHCSREELERRALFKLTTDEFRKLFPDKNEQELSAEWDKMRHNEAELLWFNKRVMRKWRKVDWII